MDEMIWINQKAYTLSWNYRENTKLREGLNQLTSKTYGFDFEDWYQAGYWGEKYIPYSLLDGEKIVANVSVNIMEATVLGEEKRYVQIGTVMTDEDYRGNGLSKYLMERVLQEWEDQCDGIYLYANDSVLNFYPKFGFEDYHEYQYTIIKNQISEIKEARKLNIDDKRDKALLEKYISYNKFIPKVSMRNNKGLLMFYCLKFMRDNIYYLEREKAIVICEYDQEIVYLQEVFTLEEVSLNQIIDGIMHVGTNRIVLGFTPQDTEGYQMDLLNEEDTTLFIKRGKDNIFKTEKVMFPTLSHA